MNLYDRSQTESQQAWGFQARSGSFKPSRSKEQSSIKKSPCDTGTTDTDNHQQRPEGDEYWNRWRNLGTELIGTGAVEGGTSKRSSLEGNRESRKNFLVSSEWENSHTKGDLRSREQRVPEKTTRENLEKSSLIYVSHSLFYGSETIHSSVLTLTIDQEILKNVKHLLSFGKKE